MCDYTQVEYRCRHLRYIVRAWCTKYQETHKRCPPNVVAVEYRMYEDCGDCKETTAKFDISSVKRPKPEKEEKQQAAPSPDTGDAGPSK